MTAGAGGLVSLVSQGELTEGSLRMKELAVPVDPIRLKFSSTKSQFKLDDLYVGAGKGNFKATGVVNDYAGQQVFNADFDLRGIDLKEVLAQEKQPVKVEGLVYGQLKIQGQGLKSENTNAISGDGNLEIKEGKLLDVNILKNVIEKISFIPHLAQSLTESLPPAFREKLEKKDTILNKVEMKTTINHGLILVDPINIDADGFEFLGQTQAHFDQSFSTEGSFFIPPDLSVEIVKISPQLQFLMTDQQKIFMPLKVNGKLSDMSFFVDPVYISGKLIENKGKDELKKVLNKVLGGDDEDSSSTPPADGSQPPQREESPEKKIIGDILDSILKK